MSTTDRHTALAWADQIDAERRACTRGVTWAQFDAAVRDHCTHAPGSLADPGTEAMLDQAMLPTQPAELDTPADDTGPSWLWGLVLLAVIVAAALISARYPWGFATPLP